MVRLCLPSNLDPASGEAPATGGCEISGADVAGRSCLLGIVRLMRFKLSHVLLLNITHELPSARKIALQSSGHLSRHDGHLIVRRLAPGDWTKDRNEMRAPLEDKSKIPQDQNDRRGLSRQPGSSLVPRTREIVQKARKAENEQNRERYEEPVAKGGENNP